MLPLDERHLDKFIKLYQKHYGIDLERAEALKKATQLCRFMEITLMIEKDDPSSCRAD